MNERIKELLEQAYDEAVPETWTTLSSEQLGRIYEKFAELIVQECMKVTVNYPHPQTKLTAAEHIARYFGIKE